MDGLWQSWQSWTNELCTICAFESYPMLNFKGFCYSSKLSWVFYPVNNGSDIIYYGYRNSIMKYVNDSWIISERVDLKRDAAIFSMKDAKLEFPVGRKEWHLNSLEATDCPDWQHVTNFTLSPCRVGEEFSCGSGYCVALSKRCDYSNDCEDQSDEDQCQSLRLNPSYRRENPPSHVLISPRIKGTRVGVSLQVLSVNRIQIDQGKIDISFQIEIFWVDERLSYFNMAGHSEKHLVRDLSIDFLDSLWNPLTLLHHENSDTGSVFIDSSSMQLKVNISNKPTTISPERSFEKLEYKGDQGVLQQSIKMKGVYDCKFDLYRFPFDQQECKVMLLLRTSHDTKMLTTFQNESVDFTGNTFLTEFEIVGTRPFLKFDNETMETKFGFFIRLKHIYQKQITALFFQILLLWIVSYLTLYIDKNDFGNRFMGSVTALLVFSALLDNINGRLPASPHVREKSLFYCIDGSLIHKKILIVKRGKKCSTEH